MIKWFFLLVKDLFFGDVKLKLDLNFIFFIMINFRWINIFRNKERERKF